MSTPPHDLDAEENVLGTMMMNTKLVGPSLQELSPDDFYRPGHKAAFEAIEALWSVGKPTKWPDVWRQMNDAGTHQLLAGRSELQEMADSTPVLSTLGKYRVVVQQHGASRRLIKAMESALAKAYVSDPAEVIEHVSLSLQNVATPRAPLPPDLISLDAALDRPVSDRKPWVVPGLLRVGWRAVVVGLEGSGKSVLLRQIAIAAAQGVHPFTESKTQPVKTLIVDLENPPEAITDTCNPIRDRLRPQGWHADKAWLWERPGGVDLRKRQDRSEFEAILDQIRPQLVALGPLYKAARRESKEGWDEMAMSLQAILDDLRTRYEFALLMEDHAPGENGGTRSIRPFGSSAWLRWPEIGIKLVPERPDDTSPHKLELKRWRGDRVKNAWPEAIERGRGLPWKALYGKDQHPYQEEQ